MSNYKNAVTGLDSSYGRGKSEIAKQYAKELDLAVNIIKMRRPYSNISVRWMKNDCKSKIVSYRLILKDMNTGKASIYNDIRPQLFTAQDLHRLIDELNDTECQEENCNRAVKIYGDTKCHYHN